MKTEKIDIYGEITNQIVGAIEAGADNYQMPWHVQGTDSVLPVVYFFSSTAGRT